jgi:uncharacterized protein YaiI (UPF0178 family)
MTGLFVGCGVASIHPEIFGAARRHSLDVYLVVADYIFAEPGVHLIVDEDHGGAGDDWIAANIAAGDICITSRIELARRCVSRGALALGADGRVWNRSAAAIDPDFTNVRNLAELQRSPAPGFGRQLEAAIAASPQLARLFTRRMLRHLRREGGAGTTSPEVVFYRFGPDAEFAA